jgi:hypothetical protein
VLDSVFVCRAGRCLLAGHVARLAVNVLRPPWDSSRSITERFERGKNAIDQVMEQLNTAALLQSLSKKGNGKGRTSRQPEQPIAASI